ncbi:MAG: acyltransferase, partial [Clostridia bacterium]|nr:acyltransferase [Clostridia bacterium]
MNNIKKDTSYITLLSVISCIAVIILHTNHVFWDFDLNNFKSANIIESVFYFAVPIFFMISGANLINYNERYSTKEYFIKRLKKTVIPFCIWNMIIFLQGNLHSGNIADINIKSIFQYMIKPPNTYYFFIPLFCIYAVIPLFSAVTKEKRKFVFSYIVIVAFSVNILIPFLKDTVYYFNTGDYWHIGVCSGYAIYPVLGYLLKEYEWNRKIKTIIYLLALTGVLMQIIGTYRLSLRDGQISIIFKGYANLSCVW